MSPYDLQLVQRLQSDAINLLISLRREHRVGDSRADLELGPPVAGGCERRINRCTCAREIRQQRVAVAQLAHVVVASPHAVVAVLHLPMVHVLEVGRHHQRWNRLHAPEDFFYALKRAYLIVACAELIVRAFGCAVLLGVVARPATRSQCADDVAQRDRRGRLHEYRLNSRPTDRLDTRLADGCYRPCRAQHIFRAGQQLTACVQRQRRVSRLVEQPDGQRGDLQHLGFAHRVGVVADFDHGRPQNSMSL